MNKPIFEYLISYKSRYGTVTCDNVCAFNRRAAKRQARNILHAGHIFKVISTGIVAWHVIEGAGSNPPSQRDAT